MSRSWSNVAGAVLFAVGATGMAVWLWSKRTQLAVAAAKAVPGQATAAAKAVPGQASAAATDQASAVADAIVKQQPPAS